MSCVGPEQGRGSALGCLAEQLPLQCLWARARPLLWWGMPGARALPSCSPPGGHQAAPLPQLCIGGMARAEQRWPGGLWPKGLAGPRRARLLTVLLLDGAKPAPRETHVKQRMGCCSSSAGGTGGQFWRGPFQLVFISPNLSSFLSHQHSKFLWILILK